MELQWSHGGELTVTGYEYRQGTGNWKVIPGSDADTVSHVVTGLTNGTQYTFQIRAVNPTGASPDSETASATPAALSDSLDGPANLQVRVDRNWVTLSWDRPSAGVDADIIYRYQVNGGAITDIPGSDATTTSYTWELLPGSHQIAIWAVNVRANRGGTILFPRVSVAGPSAPSDLRAEVGDGEVTLRWRRSPDGRIGVYEYQVDGGSWSTARGVPGNGTEFRIAGLTNKQEYTFGLRARGDWYGLANSNYGYGPSAEVTATPNQLLPAPANLAVKPDTRGTTSFTVQWDAVAKATGYVATATLSGSTIIAGTLSDTEAAFAGLASDTMYTVTVRATVNNPDYHATGRAGTLTVSTLPSVPRAPVGLAFTIGDGEVRLSWDQATDSSITGYEYRSRTGGSFTDDWVVISGSDAMTMSHTVSSLTNGTAYVFVVRAVNPTGAGASSALVRAVPLAVPAAPEGVVAEAGVASVTLRWTETTDASVTGYEYTTDGSAWMAFPSGSLHYRVTGLANGQEYTFRLRALNAEGDGTASAEVMATPEAVPGMPQNLQADEGDGQVTLTWEAPTSGGRVMRYQLWRTGAEIWTNIAGSDAMTTRHVVTGLTNGQWYQFLVRAENDVAVGSSAQVLATPMKALSILSIADASASEGDSGTEPLVFTVTLTPASDEQVMVAYATADGIGTNAATTADSDYATTTGTLTFAAGDTSKTITVQITGDETGEGNEIFTATLSDPANAVISTTAGTATGTIIDDDGPISISPIAGFTEFPTASRGVIVTATHRDSTTALRYRVEPVGWLPYGIRVGPTEATDLVSGTSEVTITNPGRRVGVVVTVRVIVTGGADEAREDFRAVFTDNVAPFVEPLLRARAGEYSGTVELMWSHAGRQRVTGYEYKQGNGAWTAVPDSHVDTTSHVVRGLSNGTSYTFRVRALNALGMGPASNAATASALGRLPAPDGLEAKSGTRGVSSFTVQWTAVSNATGYVATAATDGAAIEGTVSDTEAAFANLLPIRAYTVSVYATGGRHDLPPDGADGHCGGVDAVAAEGAGRFGD